MNETELVIFKLTEAKSARASADAEYEDAITTAIEHGMSNVKIAKVLKISEAAVRQYRKRRGIK